MRLVSCYISGFGTIKDRQYDFSNGMNAVCEENGWGKTSFSVFVKAMFYGMEYSARKKGLTERTHYLPWDGGVCGGSLTFEVEGKTYRIERTFGQKDKDDTFQLIDVASGLPSGDYTENLGEELFFVDAESFAKSIFVPQGAVGTSLTNSLNAKMGDVVAAQDDINNFDVAIKKVEDAIHDYKRTSKVNTGKLPRLRQEIRDCAEVVEKKTAVREGYEKQRGQLDEKRKILNWLLAEKDRVGEEIRQQSKREQDTGAYRQKTEFLAKYQQEMADLDTFFAAGIPTEEEHASIVEVLRQSALQSTEEQRIREKMPPQQQIDKWERLFPEEIPSQEVLEDYGAQALRMQELRLQGEHAQLSDEMQTQLEQLKYFFAKKVPSEEELTQIESDVVEISRLDGRIVEQDEKYRNLRARTDVEREGAARGGVGGSIVLLLVCITLLAGGVMLHLFVPDGEHSVLYQIICYVGAASCAVATVMQMLRVRTSHRNRKEDLQAQLAEAEESLMESRAARDELIARNRTFLSNFMLTPTDSMQQMVYQIRVNLDHYTRLIAEEAQATTQTTDAIEALSDLRMALYTSLASYAEVYQMDLYHEAAETALLDQLKKDASGYTEYLKQKELLTAAVQTGEEQEKILDAYFKRFPLPEELSRQEGLQRIQVNAERYEKLSAEIERLEEEVKNFAETYDVDENRKSVEELQQQQQEIEEQIQERQDSILRVQDAIAELVSQLDVIDEAENRQENLQEQYDRAQRKCDLLEDTKKYLNEARERFLSAYMRPLREGMNHYLALIDPAAEEASSALRYDITMNLSVRILSAGSSHEADYLSTGYRDLVDLCARFALVDVLYKKEQPMMILDDPLTNLDEEKLTRALALLRDIVKERQLIYFTCHESRMP